MYYFLLLAVLFFNLTKAYYNFSATQNQQQYLPPTLKLYNDLFKNYYKGLRPLANQSKPVNVKLHFWFKQIIKVNKVEQIMTVYCWLEVFWNDDFLKWDPAKYDGTKSLHVPANLIWQPDILVYNGANMNIDESELMTNAIVNWDGGIMLFKAVITDISCNFDMTYFPFDQQVCYVMLASWSHDGSKITLDMQDTKTYLDFYISNTEWDLLDFKAKKNMRVYECCPEAYPELLYFYVVQRNPTYYIVSLIIPSAFITVVTVVGFFTPYSSTGENTEKVSLGVTALLSLGIILLMVADKMPATSKVMPLIGKYYIGLIFIIFAAACATTITLSIQLNGNEGKPLKQRYKMMLKILAKILWVTNIDCVDQLECTQETDSELRAHQPSYCTIVNHNVGLPENFRRHSYLRAEMRELFGSDAELRQQVLSIMSKIEKTVKKLECYAKSVKRKDIICQQWAFAARVFERILMVFFIASTLIFAFYMLNLRGVSIRLNEEVMTKVMNS